MNLADPFVAGVAAPDVDLCTLEEAVEWGDAWMLACAMTHQEAGQTIRVLQQQIDGLEHQLCAAKNDLELIRAWIRLRQAA